jgi:hypothetical protein
VIAEARHGSRFAPHALGPLEFEPICWNDGYRNISFETGITRKVHLLTATAAEEPDDGVPTGNERLGQRHLWRWGWHRGCLLL